MTFTTGVRVRFVHVDAAKIVFFPRYGDMFQGAMEDFMADHIGMDVARLWREHNLGLPIVRLEIDYIKPMVLWEWIDLTMTVKSVGRSSLNMECLFVCAGETRSMVSATLVLTDMTLMKSVAWSDDLRARLVAG